MPELGRLLTAMVTPFDSEGGVDYIQARRLALALLASGSDGLVVAGTTGEGPVLSREEKLRLFAEVKAAVGHRGAVIANVGTYNTAESVEMAAQAETLGMDGLLLTVPYYNRPSQEGLFLHFKTIARASSLPCILYNIPSRTGTNMAAETTLRLAQVRNIIAIKEASGDMVQIGKIIQGAPRRFLVYSGNDEDTFAIMSLGGHGVISVASHLVGKQMQKMIDLVESGQARRAAQAHLKLMPLFKGMFVVSNPIPIKYAVGKAGINAGAPRLPLLPPDAKTAQGIDDLLAHYTLDLRAKR